MPHLFTKTRPSKGLIAPAIIAVSILFGSCGDSFMKQKVTNEAKGSFELAATADAAGNYTGAIDPNSTSTQVLRASGDLAGSAIALPPGALGMNLSITIGSGETLASSDTTQQLGLGDNTATAAGPSVSFVPSQNVQASNPFTLSIPVTGTSLTGFALGNADNDNLVVMYKWMKVADGVTSYAIGIITRDQLTIGSKSVQFQTDKFGTFQLAVTQTKITQSLTKPTTEPPLLKADAGNPLVGVWSQCYASGNGYTNSASPSTGGTNTGGTTTVTRESIAAKLNQDVTAFDAAERAKFLTTACTSSPPNSQLQMIFNVHLTNGQTTSTLSITAHKVSTANVDTTQATGSVALTSGAPATVNFYSTQFTYLTAAAAEQFYVILNNTECHFGPLPDMRRVFVSTCQSAVAVDVYCDGLTMAQASENAYASAVAAGSGAGTTSTTSNTSTSTNNNGGGGRDNLGIPMNTQNLSSREYVKFSSSTFIHSRSTFSAPGCTGAMLNRVEESGTYNVGPANAEAVMPISISFASITGTILNDQAVVFANQNPLAAGCGFNDWSVGNPKDLKSSTHCSNSNKSDGGPSIVKIKDGNIFFDDGGSGTLNTKDFMTRQQ